MSLDIHIIVAVAQNGVIGSDGDMPWRVPSDLRYFKETTLGHAVVMGRKTFESIGKPLPDRFNIVLSRQADFAPDGVAVVQTPEEAMALADDHGFDKLFVIGGGEIYRLFAALATEMDITEMMTSPVGDARFDFAPEGWRKTQINGFVQEAGDNCAYRRWRYERRRKRVSGRIREDAPRVAAQ